MRTFLSVAAVLAIACGGSTNGGDGGPADGSSEASNDNDGSVDLSKPYACGTKTCGAGEYCVHPCCGGAPLPCDPLPDSGTCPQGKVYTPNCFQPFQGPGCQPPPCTPPPPYCASKDGCIGGQTNKRDAYCLCG